ncbi:WbqC family protein [Patescibacteria group bacterium]|nr:WbqC family protein [Patescibacteria group bacterium]
MAQESINMILTAHQPAYLPWLGLIHKIAVSDAYVYLDNVQFEKNSFTNRNKIKTANGPIWLTVPVFLKDHTKKTIKDIKIDNAKNWQESHWKSICLNYKKSPYFNKYSDFFENMYKQKWDSLSEVNDYMLRWFLKELGIKVEYYKASELNFQLHKSDLVLEMCKKLEADLYVFGALGKDYAKEEDFNKEGIKIYFQDYKHPIYPQLYNEFIPSMGIIDLLFNCGDKSLEILMGNNISKKELTEKICSTETKF